jgi:hypothetical protein
VKEHEPEAGRFNAVMPIVLLPGLALISASQVADKLSGLLTNRPAGKVSLAEMFTKSTLEFGFASVKVSEVVPPSGMLEAPNSLAMVGGAFGTVTVNVAVLLVAPGPVWSDEISPVVFSNVPNSAGACTLTVIKHAPSAGAFNPRIFRALKRPGKDDAARTASSTGGATVPPDKLSEADPDVAVTVPPQSLLSSFGVAINRPAGKLSVNAIPVSVTLASGLLLGLLTVKLSKVVSLDATVSGRKSLLMVGGKIAVTVTVVAAEGALVQPLVVTVTV